MVMKPEPLVAAIEDLAGLKGAGRRAKVVLLSPQGTRLDQARLGSLAHEDHLVLVCGRYEGVDQRAIDLAVDSELSIGDYVLSGGELPALVVIEAVTRLLPGALGQPEAPARDSFAAGLLEHPQYTRPETFRQWRVPDVLLSGDHGRIARWRRLMSLWRTWQCRPELLETADLTPEEQKWVDGFGQDRSPEHLIQ